jgi:hypothetical protein
MSIVLWLSLDRALATAINASASPCGKAHEPAPRKASADETRRIDRAFLRCGQSENERESD